LSFIASAFKPSASWISSDVHGFSMRWAPTVNLAASAAQLSSTIAGADVRIIAGAEAPAKPADA